MLRAAFFQLQRNLLGRAIAGVAADDIDMLRAACKVRRSGLWPSGMLRFAVERSRRLSRFARSDLIAVSRRADRTDQPHPRRDGPDHRFRRRNRAKFGPGRNRQGHIHRRFNPPTPAGWLSPQPMAAELFCPRALDRSDQIVAGP